MLVFLPLLCFLCLVIYLGQIRPGWGWRLSFLRSAVFLGAYGVLSIEVLSLLDAVTQIALAIIWSIPLIGLSITLGVLWGRERNLRLPKVRFPENIFERIFIVGIIIVLLYILFGSIRGVALPLLVVVTSVVWCTGLMGLIGAPAYEAHGDLPIYLQDHAHKVSYRNIWIREL